MNNFEGKTVLVTGGTSGIGEACAKRFAQEGAMVIIAGRNRDRAEKILAELASPSKSGGGG